MIEETALVIEIKGDQALLETQRQSSCQSCSVKAGCGTSTLSKVVGQRSSQFIVEKKLDIQLGDKVIVAMDENALVQGSLLIYLLPLVSMILIAMLAEFVFVNEALTILFAVIGFSIALFIVRIIISGQSFKHKIQPHILRRI